MFDFLFNSTGNAGHFKLIIKLLITYNCNFVLSRFVQIPESIDMIKALEDQTKQLTGQDYNSS